MCLKPILFNTEMVKAILDGRKTVTRRLVKNINIHCEYIEESVIGPYNRYELYEVHNGEEDYDSFYSGPIENIRHSQSILDYAPCQVGDILYVMETFADTWTPSEDTGYIYKADGIPSSFPYWGNASTCKDEVWRPSLHMPKEAARIFLKVSDIRVEQMGDMTIEDMIKEGINTDGIITTDGPINYRVVNRFEELWNSTVKEDWQKFASNPWVWVIEFERCEKPKGWY